jgi:diguanylate cyclase (GGDEF)-like protein
MVLQAFKACIGCFTPGGLVFLSAIAFLRPLGLPPWMQQPVTVLPYFLLAFGFVFGWYLSNVRVILSILALVFADRGLAVVAAGGAEASLGGTALFTIAAFFLPMNLLAFSILKEDSVSTVRGVLRVLLALAQPFLVLWLCYPEQVELAAAFRTHYIEGWSGDWTPVPQPALVAFILAGVIHASRFVLHRDPVEAGSVWVLGSSFLAFHCIQFGWNPTGFLGAAGLIMVLTLVQGSHWRAYRDDLTGIAGRLAYQEAIGRLGKQYTIAVLGVDQLKSYSGSHGRSVAEQILKVVAPKLQTACRGGRVFRVSGEEFTVLFPGRSATETIVALDSIRKAIERVSLYLRRRERVWEDSRKTKAPGPRDQALPVTVSIGVAESTSGEATLEGVVKSAFRALYEAKGSGGNVIKRAVIVPEPRRRSYGGTGRIIPSGEY